MCFHGNNFCDGSVEYADIAGRTASAIDQFSLNRGKSVPIQYATQSSCQESYGKISRESKHQHADACTSKAGKQNRLSSNTITETSPENTS